MITISLCMIVRDEEKTLGKCLQSIEGIVDEIVIVDTGSTDHTKRVASQFTQKIYDFAWIDDFSAARNFSYAQASMDYILWLDADDVLLPEDAEKLKELKQALQPDTDAVMMRYNTGFDALGNVIFSCYRERLSRRNGNFKWREPVHEYLDVGWKRITSDISVTHTKRHAARSDRNIRIYESALAKGQELSPRGMYYYARELKDHQRYPEAIRWFCAFLDTKLGWVEDNIAACGELARCYLAEDRPDEALLSLLRSFSFDAPRAEICCQIGYYFKERGNHKQAAYWFEMILALEKSENTWGFYQPDCWGYIPCMELAVHYDRLGEYEKAVKYNEMAADYKPYSPAVAYNRSYFESLLGDA